LKTESEFSLSISTSTSAVAFEIQVLWFWEEEKKTMILFSVHVLIFHKLCNKSAQKYFCVASDINNSASCFQTQTSCIFSSAV